MSLHVEPLTLKQANELVARWHRHHKPVQSHRFSIGVFDESGEPHGACIVSRPAARLTDQNLVAEVSRLVTDGTHNACSILYGAAARAAQAMGYQSIQTFILVSEPGTSLKASGWTMVAVGPKSANWDRPSRPRNTPDLGQKVKWAKVFREAP